MISRTSGYALRALQVMARAPTSWHNGKTLAKELSIPEFYLKKVLQELAKVEILLSQKGPSGGFRLARSSEEITLFEVVNCLEDLTGYTSCPMGKTQCEEATGCPLHHGWREVGEEHLSWLKRTKVSVLCRPR